MACKTMDRSEAAIPAVSQDVATALALRAMQLQAELCAFQREVAQLQAKCQRLEDDNAKLGYELAVGQQWHPSDLLVMGQVEQLLDTNAQLESAKRAVERENEQLHQLVEYYEQLEVKTEVTDSVPSSFCPTEANTQKSADRDPMASLVGREWMFEGSGHTGAHPSAESSPSPSVDSFLTSFPKLLPSSPDHSSSSSAVDENVPLPSSLSLVFSLSSLLLSGCEGPSDASEGSAAEDISI